MSRTYANPPAGLPHPDEPLTGKAVFTESYAVIPHGVMRDIVTSNFPNWHGTRGWVLARPMTGFAETFAQIIMEVEAGGGSENPEPDPLAQAVLFVTKGTIIVSFDGQETEANAGTQIYVPAGAKWQVKNTQETAAIFHWFRKRWIAEAGLEKPNFFVMHEDDAATIAMPHTDGKWSTTRFVDPADMRHDMHVNIVNFLPGGRIPFEETHIMEHGLYVLEGEAKYLLNKDWVDVKAGDFMWLRAFCPQACVAEGNGPFRYLLYKDVNRHPALFLP